MNFRSVTAFSAFLLLSINAFAINYAQPQGSRNISTFSAEFIRLSASPEASCPEKIYYEIQERAFGPSIFFYTKAFVSNKMRPYFTSFHGLNEGGVTFGEKRYRFPETGRIWAKKTSTTDFNPDTLELHLTSSLCKVGIFGGAFCSPMNYTVESFKLDEESIYQWKFENFLTGFKEECSYRKID